MNPGGSHESPEPEPDIGSMEGSEGQTVEIIAPESSNTEVCDNRATTAPTSDEVDTDAADIVSTASSATQGAKNEAVDGSYNDSSTKTVLEDTANSFEHKDQKVEGSCNTNNTDETSNTKEIDTTSTSNKKESSASEDPVHPTGNTVSEDGSISSESSPQRPDTKLARMFPELLDTDDSDQTRAALDFTELPTVNVLQTMTESALEDSSRQKRGLGTSGNKAKLQKDTTAAVLSVDESSTITSSKEGEELNGTSTDGHTFSETEGDDIVLVTGGCGFLGQHVVKMLQLRAPHVGEIWVLDLVQFEQKLDYKATKPVKSIVGSIADGKFVSKALTGVHSVIHVAGLISWGTFPDYGGMEETNVVGTVNVCNACIRQGVHRLVYCSTVDVAVGHAPILGGDEETTRVPPADGFLFPGYPETKYQGERIVAGSMRPGGILQTVTLRANVLYGELDTAYVINGLKNAHTSNGILRQIGDGSAMFQQAYVGNTAWAMVRADAAMREDPELSGEVFYIPDNTPVQNSFNFMRPYLEARGFALSEDRLPYGLVRGAVRLAEIFAKGISPIYKLQLPVQSYSVAYINTSLYFNGEKAKRVLKYEPIYSPFQAREASLKYYTSVKLD